MNVSKLCPLQEKGPNAMWGAKTSLTLILLNTTTLTFANSVDPDQMASEEAILSGSTLFVMQFVNWMNSG